MSEGDGRGTGGGRACSGSEVDRGRDEELQREWAGMRLQVFAGWGGEDCLGHSFLPGADWWAAGFCATASLPDLLPF